MVEWLRVLRESPIDWLLEESNPSVRYFTLCDILDKPETDLEVMAARKAISKSTVVQKILRKQHPQGYWDKPDSPYLPKYKSSYWTIMILGQLGINRTNEKVAKACEFIFQFQHEAGGFSSHSQNSASREYEYLAGKGKKLPPKDEYVSLLVFEEQLSCLTGNMVAALVRMGYVNDLRVKRALEWLVKIQNNDGGWLCPYWKAHVKDKHGCFLGTICPMEALSEVPKEKLTNEMKQAISKGADFLLMHRLFKADHHDYNMINQTWLQLSFPRFAGYNVLRGLDVLTKLGYVKDDRLDDAVEVLVRKRQGNGVWILENSHEGRM